MRLATVHLDTWTFVFVYFAAFLQITAAGAVYLPDIWSAGSCQSSILVIHYAAINIESTVA